MTIINQVGGYSKRLRCPTILTAPSETPCFTCSYNVVSMARVISIEGFDLICDICVGIGSNRLGHIQELVCIHPPINSHCFLLCDHSAALARKIFSEGIGIFKCSQKLYQFYGLLGAFTQLHVRPAVSLDDSADLG
jgi:hypothetical protein